MENLHKGIIRPQDGFTGLYRREVGLSRPRGFARRCLVSEMSSGRTGRGRGRGRGGVRSKTLPYVPLCSSPISQPSSSGNSNGPPQQPVVQDEELQHEIPTGPSQQQGTTGSASIDSSAIILQGRDPTDGKIWIQPCGQS
ncbi:DDB1- and CUL4-associated factor 8 isoform X1 [Senna tora]|uniref:DDB1- and CUL4-associated factor 8 isoform X1 n=1 Tax=Senna tora TaxID=362788 RepID=A0A834W6F6_9FABA|nr:DDB1- and CUL4-associated factor 8 isoform X1 [Senna tora]